MTTGLPSSPAQCRLCGGATEHRFEHRVLGRLAVGYHECRDCKSLQTDPPHWLDEAYGAASLNLNALFAPQRCRFMQARLLVVARLFGLPRQARVLDVGGETGLLCRMLRDVGFDAYSFDLFATNYFAPEYAGTLEADYDLISAVEVWEHFANPALEARACFARRPAVIVVGTSLWEGQGRAWPYLFPSTGQHVFLYSRPAMEWLARSEGYDVWVSSQWTVFSRAPIGRRRRAALAGERWLTKATECTLPLLSPLINRGIQAEIDERLSAATHRPVK